MKRKHSDDAVEAEEQERIREWVSHEFYYSILIGESFDKLKSDWQRCKPHVDESIRVDILIAAIGSQQRQVFDYFLAEIGWVDEKHRQGVITYVAAEKSLYMLDKVREAGYPMWHGCEGRDDYLRVICMHLTPEEVDTVIHRNSFSTAKLTQMLRDEDIFQRAGVVQVLLSHGADPNGMRYNFFRPLAFALDETFFEEVPLKTVCLLLAHGADPNDTFLVGHNTASTPFILLCEKLVPHASPVLFSCYRKFLEYGADLEEDCDGNYPWEYFAAYGEDFLLQARLGFPLRPTSINHR